MWDVPQFQMRAYVRALRDSRKGKSKIEKRRALRLRRVAAEIKVTSKFGQSRLIPARLLLEDLNPRSVRIFTPERIQTGQHLSILIPGTRHFFARARVVGCEDLPIKATSVLTPIRYAHRITLQFFFDSEAERELVRTYCREVV